MPLPSYEELAASVAELRESLVARDSLIAELQRLLEEAFQTQLPEPRPVTR